MKYRVISPSDLDAGLMARWVALQSADPALASPYFSPEFTASVGRLRTDARVTVIEDGGRVVGFFPFQVGRFGRGRPIGGALSDFHGLIAERDAAIPAVELLRLSGLTVWEFDHLVASCRSLGGVVGQQSVSPVMDLSSGYEAYAEGRRAAGSEQIKKTGTLARKLEREHGPAEFAARVTDTAALECLMGWKSQQCMETGTIDVFGVDWTRRLLYDLQQMESPAFGGMLSTLTVRGKLVAAHFGMRSCSTWHYWFPSYHHEFGKFSPGLVLLLRMAQAANELRLTRIDLGKGDSFYKSRLANAGTPLLEGRVEVPSIPNSVRALWRQAESCIDSGPIARTIGLPIRAIRRWKRLRRYV